MSTTRISLSGWHYPGNNLKTGVFDFCKSQALLKGKGSVFVLPWKRFRDEETGARKLRTEELIH